MKPSLSTTYHLPPTNKRVAIVHDWLYGGGAEQVVLELHRMFPEAPIYTSYCTDEWRQKLDNQVITGYLQHWPFSTLRKFLPVLRQRWFRKLDLSQFDLVISSSGNGEAKFIRINNPRSTNYNLQSTKQIHVCYCHSPTHFYWRHYDSYLQNPGFGFFNPVARLGLKLLVKPLRKADYEAAQQVDQFIANSTHIQQDIKTYYNRDSVVIHPPVDTERFAAITRASAQNPQPSFIMWGRHVPFKHFDMAVQACTQLNLPLVVMGEGPDTVRLKKLAGPTVAFTGWVDHQAFDEQVSHAQAFIFPGEEDFGIAPVEAMAAGLPIIAYKAGGALDYVNEKTGVFFEQQDAGALAAILQAFDANRFDSYNVQAVSRKFSVDAFHQKMTDFLGKFS